jgi:hypothetical protein
LFLPPNGKYIGFVFNYLLCLLFVEYQSYRTAKAMGAFILENQRGDKQVFIAQKEDKLTSLFNETGVLPRVVLMSHKNTVPPMLKTLCYKHRKKVILLIIFDEFFLDNVLVHVRKESHIKTFFKITYKIYWPRR